MGGNSHGLARAVLFNARPFSQRTFRGEVGRAFRAAYQSVTTWPEHDLFEAYAGAARESAEVTTLPVDMTSDAAALHQALVDQLKDDGHIESPRVEGAFRAVPRHHFLPEQPIAEAYRNRAIPTKHLDGEAVSSSSEPAIMAIMLEMLDLQPGQNVLEIGAGTGYNAALMAQIVGETGQVTAIDIDQDIVEAAQAHLAAAGAEAAAGAAQGVCVLRGDGAVGHAEGAPFDRIVLTVAATDLSPAWREQLKPDGRLLLPFRIGGILTQKVVLFAPLADRLETVSVRGGWFMMLRGEHAQGRTRLPLGPDTGLVLWADDPPPADAETLYGLLNGPGRDWQTWRAGGSAPGLGRTRLLARAPRAVALRDHVDRRGRRRGPTPLAAAPPIAGVSQHGWPRRRGRRGRLDGASRHVAGGRACRPDRAVRDPGTHLRRCRPSRPPAAGPHRRLGGSRPPNRRGAAHPGVSR